MYRITISTPEHGTLLDQEVLGFVLLRKTLCEHDDPTHDPVLTVDARGVNEYEQVGLFEWAKALAVARWADQAEEGPGLADYPG